MRKLAKQNACEHQGGRQVWHLVFIYVIHKRMERERERDAISSTILQEEPDRDLLMENEGIIGEDYQVMSEPNSLNLGTDGDLGRLAADAYEEPAERRDVSSIHGKYDYHKSLSTPETAIYTKGDQLFVASRGTTLDKDWGTALTDATADTGIVGGVLSGFDDGGLTDRIARDQAVYQTAQDLFPRHEADFTGHSLGGYVAKNLADANKFKATTFNPGVGIPSNLDIKCLFADYSHLKSYHVVGDPISALNRRWGAGKHHDIAFSKLNTHWTDNFKF